MRPGADTMPADGRAAALARLLRLPAQVEALPAEVAAMHAEFARLREALPPALVSVTAAAERLGVSVPTVRRMIKKGSLASVRVGSGIRGDATDPRSASGGWVGAREVRCLRGKRRMSRRAPRQPCSPSSNSLRAGT